MPSASRRPRSRRVMPPRVLIDAEAIVRSARADDIDWTREPLTERERKVRLAILSRVQTDPLMVMAFGLYYPPASDLEAMLKEVHDRGEANMARLVAQAKAEVDAGLFDDDDEERGS